MAATDEDIQIEIDSLIEEYTTYEQERGIAQEGDMVYADFEGSIGGKKVDSICGSDYVELGSGGWAPGFEDAIMGMQCGQKKNFKLTVPENFYGDNEIDGKEISYTVTLKYICGESIIPEYNDEFVQSISNYDTVEEHTASLKKKLENEGSELSEKIGQLKLKSKDGKFYNQDVLDMKGILRLIESVPSPKAEPFKLWLASLGSERIDEVFDPEIAINRAVNYYRNKGYTDEWIKARLMGIVDRFKLTDIWKEGGINKPIEYALLTNEIYKG